MSRVAEVIAIDRSAEPAAVKVDPEDPCTPDHYQPAGDDALPLKGDFAAVSDDEEGSSSGECVGYHDPVDANRKAAPGEKRIYARSPDGVCVGEIWLKGDGTLALKSTLATVGGSIEIKPSGEIVANGVEIGTDGVIKCSDVVLTQTMPPQPPALSMAKHLHQSTAPGTPTGPAVAPPEEP